MVLWKTLVSCDLFKMLLILEKKIMKIFSKNHLMFIFHGILFYLPTLAFANGDTPVSEGLQVFILTH